MSSSGSPGNGDLFGQLRFTKKDIFKEVIEKYSQPVETDVIDLKAFIIAEDWGYVRRMKKRPFAVPEGFFTQPLPQYIPEEVEDIPELQVEEPLQEVKEAEAQGSNRRKKCRPQKRETPPASKHTKRQMESEDDSESPRKKIKKLKEENKKMRPNDLKELELYKKFKKLCKRKQTDEIEKKDKQCHQQEFHKQQKMNQIKKRKMEEEKEPLSEDEQESKIVPRVRRKKFADSEIDPIVPNIPTVPNVSDVSNVQAAPGVFESGRPRNSRGRFIRVDSKIDPILQVNAPIVPNVPNAPNVQIAPGVFGSGLPRYSKGRFIRVGDQIANPMRVRKRDEFGRFIAQEGIERYSDDERVC